MLLKSGAGVLAGFESPAKMLFPLGVSGVALLACSAPFGVSAVWPKLKFGVLDAGSCAFGVSDV